MRTYKNFDLTPYNSYRVYSECTEAVFPETDDDIRWIYSQEDLPKIIIGSGHNIILSKEFYHSRFIIFSGNFSSVQICGNKIRAQSGVSLLELSVMTWARGLSGLEIFYDIPSSLGGAVVMNAGAGGEEIKDSLIRVKYYDPKKDNFYWMDKDSMSFDYRNSFFQRNPHLLIIEAELELSPKPMNEIRSKMETTKNKRWEKQPKNFPNAGSVFKRPNGCFVGPMIEELGLKGYQIGGAQVSEKHAGFIVNKSNASGSDIVTLIEYLRQKVLEKFSVDLQVEQRII